MAPRAYWKGYLKLSLVSCPIALYPASSSSERVSFNRINKKTGSRLKQQNVDAETGSPVDREDIGRGYEIGKRQRASFASEWFMSTIRSSRALNKSLCPLSRRSLGRIESPSAASPQESESPPSPPINLQENPSTTPKNRRMRLFGRTESLCLFNGL